MGFVLLFPAVLFMASLIVRTLQPLQSEPAFTAQRIVLWYSVREWTLWVLLTGLPFAVLLIGGVTLLRIWFAKTEPPQAALRLSTTIRLHPATLLITAETLAAGVILAVVAVHILMN